MIIRLLLLSAIAGIGYYAFLRRSKLPINIVVLLLLLGVASAFIIRPHLSDHIAHLVGVGRGVDLITYVVEVTLFFIALHYYMKFVELQSQLTTVVRELALTRARVDELARREA
jgi:hypothetical protein